MNYTYIGIGVLVVIIVIAALLLSIHTFGGGGGGGSDGESYDISKFWYNYNAQPVYTTDGVVELTSALDSSVQVGDSVTVTITSASGVKSPNNESTLTNAFSSYQTTIAAISADSTMITLSDVPSALEGESWAVVATGTVVIN